MRARWRRRVAAGAVAVTAGCSSGYVPAASPTPAPAPSSAWPSAEPVVDMPLGTRMSVGPDGTVWSWNEDTDPLPAADVDGDRLPDVLAAVESGDQADDTWRWGVRVQLSRLGTQTLWRECCPDRGEVVAVGDVDGDGDEEFAGVDGTTAIAAGWFLATVHRGRLTAVSGPDLWTGLEEWWGCVPGGIVVARATGATSGTRTYYRLDGTRLVRAREVRDTWGGSVPRPREYDERPVSC